MAITTLPLTSHGRGLFCVSTQIANALARATERHRQRKWPPPGAYLCHPLPERPSDRLSALRPSELRRSPPATTVRVMESKTLSECQAHALRLLARYTAADEDTRTPILRELAETLIDARQHFLRADGTVDIKGQTYAYRQWVRDLYATANIKRDQIPTVQAAVRYHVSTVLRQRLSQDELEAEGLIERSSRQRSQDRRANRSAILNAYTGREIHGTALLSLSAAYNVLSRVTPDELESLGDRERAIAADALRDMAGRAEALLRRVERG